MPIQAITFDPWDVLYADDANRRTARLKQRTADVLAYFSTRRMFFEPAEVEAAITAVEAMFQCPGRESLTGQEIGQQLNLLLLKKKLARQHCDELAELLSLAGLRHPPRLLPEAADILSLLSQRCKIGLILNTDLTLGREWAEILRLDGLARQFSCLAFSDQTLSAKPLERPFLYTLSMLGVPPTDAVHVSAHQTRDLQPARSLGMRTILVAKGDVGTSTTQADACITGLAQIFGVLHRWEERQA